MDCGISSIEKKTFSCTECNYATTKKPYLTRHMKRHTAANSVSNTPSSSVIGEVKPGTSSTVVSPDLEWEDQDPGNLIVSSSSEENSDESSGEESGDSSEDEEPPTKEDLTQLPNLVTEQTSIENLEEGRVIRKPTRPNLPFHKKRPSSELDAAVSAKKRLMDPKNIIPLPVNQPTKEKTSRKSVGIQTDTCRNVRNAQVQTDLISCKRSKKTITKYRDSEKIVKVVNREVHDVLCHSNGLRGQ